ncbi:MAG TPA: flagellar assembly protein FliW [Solirubrobacteraceae bacterium]|nr:flagellar assembly protein FliW [Solirubrobacteraceae bacterium]
MPITIESIRFGTLDISDDAMIELPLGLIGLDGSRYALLERNPDSGFLWLHSLEDPALALPVVDPRRFFPDFSLQLMAEDLEQTGFADPSAADVYVTVRAAPDPQEITVNLRAPIVVSEGRGYQVLNTVPGAKLRAPLFGEAAAPERSAVDAA